MMLTFVKSSWAWMSYFKSENSYYLKRRKKIWCYRNFISSAFLRHFHKQKQSKIRLSKKQKKIPPFVHTIISPEDTKDKLFTFHLSVISNVLDFC